MRGVVLKPDNTDGAGLILGEDGKRYRFTTARVHKSPALASGTPVDFIVLGEEARDIYVLAAQVVPPEGVRVRTGAPVAPAGRDSLFKYFLRAISRNYFNFTGRARRAEYWGFVLFQIIMLILLLIPDTIITALAYSATDPDRIEFIPLFTGLFYLYSIVPGTAIAVRRLHDRDLSGWLYLLILTPYIGGLILFIFMCLDSRRETNKHGPSPKYGADAQVDAFA